ncbi:CAP domain-containing protein [Bombardia bombarda]|uniref:CAP domain-containing protein n=1 Tax=Bombardia bombarda TaxID=252184 RepID=A0AA39XMV7_9PEZI|nr:CAP domain-containing protein [Bombardia bombarda]
MVSLKSLLTSALGTALLFSHGAVAHALPEIHVDNVTKSPPPTDKAFQQNVLTTVNNIRKKYKANPLIWNTTLASVTLNKANGCKLDHSGPYGENAYSWWSKPVDAVPNFTTKVQTGFNLWISDTEIAAYKKGDLLGGGHFTQTVWKASKQIGCAFSTTRCPPKAPSTNEPWWFYCDFFPRGNFVGYYPGNVTVV